MLTFERLEEVGYACARIREIQVELNNVYNTYRSPSFNNRRCNTEPADPVTKAVHKATKLHDELDRLLKIRLDFEDELEGITDPEVCAIIRWHYCIGLSWKDTSWRVYHSQSYFAARDKVRWYLAAPHHEPKEST